MRSEFLLRYFGRFHLLVSLAFLIPIAVGVGHGDFDVTPFLTPALCLAAFGLVLTLIAGRMKRGRGAGLRRREGFVVVSGSWISIILWGAIPFLFVPQIPDLASAIFESASGFTTTGATILLDIELLPESFLFWRSFSHWLGGMGIIVLSVAILPELAVGGMQLISAESSGLSVDRLAPRIASTAKRLWVLYVALTGVEIALLWIHPDVNLFDAVNHAFATTATGGFSTKQASVAHFDSLYFDVVVTVFMLLAGLNFALQFRALSGEHGKLFTSTETRWYLGLFLSVTALITWNLIDAGIYSSIGEALRYTGFQVSAILTTTGFGTADFDRWPTFSKCLLVVLMTIGGCAGSTAGGLKVIRLVVVLKHAVRECQRLIYPRMVKPVMIDRKAVEEETLFSILGFFLLYMLVFVLSMVLLSVLPHEQPMSITTAATASLSALNSIGPGLEGVGPAESFAWIHPFGKLTLSFCMLLGRLEIYSLLILFMPRFWWQR